AHQRNLGGLVNEAGGVGEDRRAGKLGDAERVVRIWTDGARDQVRALAHEPRIGAIKQDRADFRVRAPQKCVDPGGRQLHQPPAAWRRCMNIVSRAAISSRNSWTVRTRASSSVTTVA